MTKKDWYDLYEKLNMIYYEFSLSYSDYQKGKTIRIKEEGINKCHSLIQKTISILSANDEAYRLIFNNLEYNELRDNTILEDFKKPHYFDKDMGILVDKIFNIAQSAK